MIARRCHVTGSAAAVAASPRSCDQLAGARRRGAPAEAAAPPRRRGTRPLPVVLTLVHSGAAAPRPLLGPRVGAAPGSESAGWEGIRVAQCGSESARAQRHAAAAHDGRCSQVGEAAPRTPAAAGADSEQPGRPDTELVHDLEAPTGAARSRKGLSREGVYQSESPPCRGLEARWLRVTRFIVSSACSGGHWQRHVTQGRQALRVRDCHGLGHDRSKPQ